MLASRATGGVAPPSASPMVVAGPAAAAGPVVAVGPASTAGAVVVVGPIAAATAGTAAGPAPGAAVGAEAAVAVVVAEAETAAAPLASPAVAAGDGAAAAEPGSYSTPTTPLSSGAWGPAPPQRIRCCGRASGTFPPRGPCCSKSWPPPTPSLCQRVLGLRSWTGRSLDRRAGGCRAKRQGFGCAIGVTPHLLDRQATVIEGRQRHQDHHPHPLVFTQSTDPSRQHQQLQGVCLAGHPPDQDLQLRVG
jgi:hypothetical protein